MVEYKTPQLINYFFVEKRAHLRLPPEQQAKLLQLAQTNNLPELVAQLQAGGITFNDRQDDRLCSQLAHPTIQNPSAPTSKIDLNHRRDIQTNFNWPKPQYREAASVRQLTK